MRQAASALALGRRNSGVLYFITLLGTDTTNSHGSCRVIVKLRRKGMRGRRGARQAAVPPAPRRVGAGGRVASGYGLAGKTPCRAMQKLSVR
jgi:hypothetical protein